MGKKPEEDKKDETAVAEPYEAPEVEEPKPEKKGPARKEYPVTIDEYGRAAGVSAAAVAGVSHWLGNRVLPPATWEKVVKLFREKPADVDFIQFLAERKIKV